MLALFADVITQEARELGTMGSQALLGVAVLALVAALVFIFKTWRADTDKHQKRLDDQQEKHDTDIKEQRAEHTAAMGKVGDAMKALTDESRAHTQECRANFALLSAEVKQLKEKG